MLFVITVKVEASETTTKKPSARYLQDEGMFPLSLQCVTIFPHRKMLQVIKERMEEEMEGGRRRGSMSPRRDPGAMLCC